MMICGKLVSAYTSPALLLSLPSYRQGNQGTRGSRIEEPVVLAVVSLTLASSPLNSGRGNWATSMSRSLSRVSCQWQDGPTHSLWPSGGGRRNRAATAHWVKSKSGRRTLRRNFHGPSPQPGIFHSAWADVVLCVPRQGSGRLCGPGNGSVQCQDLGKTRVCFLPQERGKFSRQETRGERCGYGVGTCMTENCAEDARLSILSVRNPE